MLSLRMSFPAVVVDSMREKSKDSLQTAMNVEDKLLLPVSVPMPHIFQRH
jgi:hypothetical protein